MKTIIHPITDYQNALLITLKERFPSFLLGLFITSYLAYFALTTIGIKKETAKVKENTVRFESVKTYTVKLNDDLWSIAETMYGSGYNAEDIARANKLSEPYTLTENQILLIPSISPKTPTTGELTEKAIQTERAKEYTVQPGDYLWQIAEKLYGDGNQMNNLIESNNIPYPFNVEEGQILLVP